MSEQHQAGFNKGLAEEKQLMKLSSAGPSSASCPSQVRAPGGHELLVGWCQWHRARPRANCAKCANAVQAMQTPCKGCASPVRTVQMPRKVLCEVCEACKWLGAKPSHTAWDGDFSGRCHGSCLHGLALCVRTEQIRWLALETRSRYCDKAPVKLQQKEI